MDTRPRTGLGITQNSSEQKASQGKDERNEGRKDESLEGKDDVLGLTQNSLQKKQRLVFGFAENPKKQEAPERKTKGRKERTKEGRKEGRNEGRKEGEKEGKKEGRKEGRKE
jgi:hypothetical protein